MSPFRVHDLSSAPAGSRPILEATQKALGFVPNLFGVFAASPAVLEAYATLSALQERKGAFSETERQVLFLAISIQNGCEYCVAAHSTLAGLKTVAPDVVGAVRDSRSLPTPKLEALRAFAQDLVERRGHADAGALKAFLSAGYEERHVLEVVLAVAFKTLSNYTNHVAGTPLDAAFQPNTWSAGAAV